MDPKTRTSLLLLLVLLSGAGLSLAATFTVSTTADSGAGSLRQALQDANASAGLDTIVFAIPGSGPFTIQPLTMLPVVTDPVVIDGSTQPGSGGVPIVELDGTSSGSGSDGLQITADGCTVRGLVINRFQGNGINVVGGSNQVVVGNYLGTDATGTLALGNNFGVVFFSSNGNRVGGTAAGEGNLVSGNALAAVVMTTSNDNTIQGNRIGSDVTGTIAVGNGSIGFGAVWIVNGGVNNLVGGTTTTARNLISGNLGDGIKVQFSGSAATPNRIQGNDIGTDVTGNSSLPNLRSGVRIESSSFTQVGGSGAGEGNLISGNQFGVTVLDTSGGSFTGNRIQGNRIGTNASGTAVIGNGIGVSLESFSQGTTLGGTAAGAGNVISGNLGGISMLEASLNVVEGNLVGTDVTGTQPLGNTNFGVGIGGGQFGGQNTIGGTAAGAGNVIAFNGSGVIISGSEPVFPVQNPVLGNSIHSNTGLAVDLGGDGVTANDAGDADTGANNLQNYPVLASADTTTTDITIQGSLNSTANTAFRLELFSNASCDASGFGEAEVFLGFTTATTDAGGSTAFAVTLPAPVPVGQRITATATDPQGNTSEISGCVTAGGVADLSANKTDGQTTAIPGSPITYTIVVGNAGPSAVTGASVTDTLPATLQGATWTCTATPGSSCAPSGSGNINDSVGLLVGGTAIYTLTASIDPAATGTLANTATIALPAGGSDPNPGNDSATDTDTLTPTVDLAVTKTDGQTTAIPGNPITYTIAVGNAGPSAVTGASVTDTLPATLQGATWTCTASPGSSCAASGSGGINDSVALLVGGTATYTLTATVDAAATGTLVNTATVTAPAGASDPNPANDSATDVDTLLVGLSIESELAHGYERQHDLASLPGPTPDEDLFRILQRAHRSYEVVLDGASGDLGSGSGPLLDRLAPDASTVIQTSSSAGAGGSRSLRWMNALDTPVSDEFVRVRSAGCTTTCDASDVYRLSVRETTGFIARFNNSGSQITILVLENIGDQAVDLDVRLWSGTGAPVGGPTLQTLGPHQAYVLNTSTIAPGTSGSITVGNTGRYGQLGGKAVAIEPATGFTFDTGMDLRPR